MTIKTYIIIHLFLHTIYTFIYIHKLNFQNIYYYIQYCKLTLLFLKHDDMQVTGNIPGGCTRTWEKM